jgi:hypothetical protein
MIVNGHHCVLREKECDEDMTPLDRLLFFIPHLRKEGESH